MPATELISEAPGCSPRQQAASLLTSHSSAGSVLRAGTCGNWSFCHEEYGIVGMRAGTLSALSQGTETIGMLRGADGMNRFAHWRHGQCAEQFEPGAPSTKPPGPHPWWTAVQKRLDATGGPHLGLAPVMEAVFRRAHAVIDAESLDGPLLTLWLDENRDAPPAPRPSSSGSCRLGRALGPAVPGVSHPATGRAPNAPAVRRQPSSEGPE
ncbi:DUF6461 domain-containing protein [Streptomyces sp. NPDC059970]|uniref:DUF6461 domain-containing protein n=1 Tax=Streptomyces sp. NPDC059970 TaxID=3347019 RepID=UPI0036B33DD5